MGGGERRFGFVVGVGRGRGGWSGVWLGFGLG